MCPVCPAQRGSHIDSSISITHRPQELCTCQLIGLQFTAASCRCWAVGWLIRECGLSFTPCTDLCPWWAILLTQLRKRICSTWARTPEKAPPPPFPPVLPACPPTPVFTTDSFWSVACDLVVFPNLDTFLYASVWIIIPPTQASHTSGENVQTLLADSAGLGLWQGVGDQLNDALHHLSGPYSCRNKTFIPDICLDKSKNRIE